jgi:lipoate-protein ligase A
VQPQLHSLEGSLGSPAADLACDEALLEGCESGKIPTCGILRFWEPTQPFIVLGYANHAQHEINLEGAAAEKVPIFRRCSGGGCVLQNSGCLNYSLILPVTFDRALASVSQTNCFIMQHNRDAVAAVTGKPVSIQGYTDLAIEDKKISGNSQRRKTHWVLFHGTFLFDCDFALMEQVLRPPSRQPEYRNDRRHSDFLTYLHCPPADLKNSLRRTWNATTPLNQLPQEDIQGLVKEKYTRQEWTFRW